VKRLGRLILIFCLAVSIPLGYLVVRTYGSLKQEEVAELRYFAETLFDRMEEELGTLVRKEEGRDIGQYKHNYMPGDQVPGYEGLARSPLSQLPEKPYVLGYLQNNPDGSFETPLIESQDAIPEDRANVVMKLSDANEIFNLKRTSVPESFEIAQPQVLAEAEKEERTSFADKYLDLSRSKRQTDYLGQEKKRVEQVPARKALSLGQQVESKLAKKSQVEGWSEKDEEATLEGAGRSEMRFRDDRAGVPAEEPAEELQVEVDPMQSVFVNDHQVFVFRRIVINNQIYRQGFVIETEDLLDHLAKTYFAEQPMAHFTALRLKIMDQGKEVRAVQAGKSSQHPRFSVNRSFPRPFSFLRANLTSEEVPKSAGRRTLNIVIAALAGIMLLGLFAIYQSARSIEDLSERRSNFVSSVTHEVKTPLTNIRMYIEMLEQGIARDRDREQDYFRIVGSESERLSRLINNVLEFSKLEKKQRHFDLQEGPFEDVIQDVQDIMQEKLRQEGFTLTAETEQARPFKYDREVMIQILTNLIENSVKFGRTAPRREITLRVRPKGDWMNISVSDTGPGIPRHALKKVFDDFYRVEGDLTRTTSGTGIGLALVKRFVTAMGGSIEAKNNEGPGCTITISLPV
jgi:signal transduction histidine kinase